MGDIVRLLFGRVRLLDGEEVADGGVVAEHVVGVEHLQQGGQPALPTPRPLTGTHENITRYNYITATVPFHLLCAGHAPRVHGEQHVLPAHRVSSGRLVSHLARPRQPPPVLHLPARPAPHTHGPSHLVLGVANGQLLLLPLHDHLAGPRLAARPRCGARSRRSSRSRCAQARWPPPRICPGSSCSGGCSAAAGARRPPLLVSLEVPNGLKANTG